MVADKDTNFVYFSSKILKDEFKEPFNKVQAILDNHSIRYDFLKYTKDIWCRDYMPIQLEKDKFIQFHYNPSYLFDYPELKSDPIKILKSNKIHAQQSEINLDGGNVVKIKDKAVVTERIFKENPGISHTKVHQALESYLEAQVFIIPDIKNDLTGHSDGHLRFVNNGLLVVNELKNEYKYWIKGFESMIKLANLNYVEIPSFNYNNKSYPDNAIGCYVNYLEIGKLILFPVFDVMNNKDEEALNVIHKLFPDRIIEQVNINKIALHGGLLNCISWTIVK